MFFNFSCCLFVIVMQDKQQIQQYEAQEQRDRRYQLQLKFISDKRRPSVQVLCQRCDDQVGISESSLYMCGDSEIQLKNKESFKKQIYCVICFRNFSGFFRQHHCRICANAVCADCSRSMINKERACDLCIMKNCSPHQQKKKKEILTTLETLCAYLIYRRNQKMAELQALKLAPSDNSEDLLRELELQERTLHELEQENNSLKQDKDSLQKQLEQIRESNAQIEESIAIIERDMGNQAQSFS